GVQGQGWISNPQYALWTIIILHIWTFGSPMIIFLAGLRQIPETYYDAAKVDGASPLRQFFWITLPLLTPIIFFNLVLQVIFAFQSFTQAYIEDDLSTRLKKMIGVSSGSVIQKNCLSGLAP